MTSMLTPRLIGSQAWRPETGFTKGRCAQADRQVEIIDVVLGLLK